MQRLALFAAFIVSLLTGCTPLAWAAPQDAVVRINSHGCSGTVIATYPGRSLILTCAHAWEKEADRRSPIAIDTPSPTPGAAVRTSSPRLIRIDHEADLALIEMSAGPLPYVCPVAIAGSPAPRRCLSVGYDAMRWPAQAQRTQVRGSSGRTTYTVERPRHGRSGGALINEQGHLVGVVSGYEVEGSQRGLYASHAAILRFLGSSNSDGMFGVPRAPGNSPSAPFMPRIWEDRSMPGIPPGR